MNLGGVAASPGQNSGDQAQSAQDVAPLSQPWKAMADLAEAVDDLICSFDYSYSDAAMDTLVMFAFFWLIFSLAMAWLIKFLYKKYKERSEKKSATEDVSAARKTIDAVEKKPADEVAAVVAKDVAPVAAAVKSKPVAKPPMMKMSGGPLNSTTPTKKRGSRMSPGPDLQRKPMHGLHPPPVASGPDLAATRWTNMFFAWLYSDLVVVNDLLQLWILSMNEFSKKSVEEHGVGIELVRVLGETPAPKISNVFCECDSKDDVTITCDCEATPAFQLKAFRQKGDKVEVAHYRVNVNRFRARLNVLCVTEKLNGELRTDGWPDVKVALAPVGPIRSNNDEPQLQEVIIDIMTSALRNINMQYSVAHYPTCPRLRRQSETPSRTLPLHYDSMNPLFASTPSQGYNEQLLSGDKRLLVKVVGAANLGDGVSAPYCVLEVDEPPQKNQTTKRDGPSPHWDEHFLFELSPHTCEILLEVFDKSTASLGQGPRFLGLGIVGIEELLISPSQRQTISLQTRPLQDDAVTGTLTVEFMFIEGADIPLTDGGKPFKVKETLKSISPTQTMNRNVYKQDGMNGNLHNINSPQPADMDRKPSFNYPDRSGLTIHNAQRLEITSSGEFVEVESKKSVEETVEKNEAKELKSDIENKNVAEIEITSTPTGRGSEKKVTVDISKNVLAEDVANGELRDQFNGNDLDGKQIGDMVEPSTEANGEPPERIPRQKKRRDFFGNIKRRLGRSRTKSMDLPDSAADERPNGRSVSADRNHYGENSLTVSSPSRNYNSGPSSTNSPMQSGDESRTSRRSSISEMSAVSGASTRTYLHEASTLVLETIDNGVKKHFLVPLSIAQRSRWRRKGTKLHIFNDHTFVAKHLSGSVVCQVCNKNIARRIGKQGYECRDCLMQCHKHCHVRVPQNCQQSTIQNMELQYITSPYADKNIRML